MIFARPRFTSGWGQPQIPQMGLQGPQQFPQLSPTQPGIQPAVQQPGIIPGIQGGLHPGLQLPPELLARLQQMQSGLGGYQPQAPQVGLGRPGIQPISPASAYSFR